MKTITIRDLRQRWPEAEAALRVEEEIIVTRDAKPVARLLPVATPESRRKRWDADAHLRWLKKVWGGKMAPDSDAALARARADRWEERST
jgi:antitoxin (DNA-binding transcriptional repressor) of toxin-antitoxin stability system